MLAVCTVTAATAHTNNGSVLNAASLVDAVLEMSPDADVKGHYVMFEHNQVDITLVFDEHADRMRLVAPIVEVSELKDGQLMKMLEANFHTSLDVRYAVSGGKVWAAFLHPLSQLHADHLRDAADQVASATLSFGSSYSAGRWIFVGHVSENEAKAKKVQDKLEKESIDLKEIAD
jgi:hypothetical protein